MLLTVEEIAASTWIIKREIVPLISSVIEWDIEADQVVLTLTLTLL